jgi:membrane fusion protein (multidrug efflux system)
LLEVSINYNERNALSIPDTSILMEGNNVYVYKVDKENIVKKIEVEIGLRNQGLVEIKSGLENGDTIVAEGLRKTRSNEKLNLFHLILNKLHQVGKENLSLQKQSLKKIKQIGKNY